MDSKSRKSKAVYLTSLVIAGSFIAYSASSSAASHVPHSAIAMSDAKTQRIENLPANQLLAMQIPAPSGHKRHQPYNPIARSGSGLEGGGEGGDGGGGGGGGGGW